VRNVALAGAVPDIAGLVARSTWSTRRPARQADRAAASRFPPKLGLRGAAAASTSRSGPDPRRGRGNSEQGSSGQALSRYMPEDRPTSLTRAGCHRDRREPPALLARARGCAPSDRPIRAGGRDARGTMDARKRRRSGRTFTEGRDASSPSQGAGPGAGVGRSRSRKRGLHAGSRSRTKLQRRGLLAVDAPADRGAGSSQRSITAESGKPGRRRGGGDFYGRVRNRSAGLGLVLIRRRDRPRVEARQ